MKKLPKDHLSRQKRIIADRVKRRRRRRPSYKKSKKAQKHYITSPKRDWPPKLPGRERLFAPKHLSLYAETANETIQFVSSIKKAVNDGSKLLLDLSKLEYISAAGAVYLYSEIDCIQNEYKPTTVRIDRRTLKNQPRYVIWEFGILNLANGSAMPTGEVLPVISGKDNEYIKEIIDYLFTKAHLERQLTNVTVAEAEHLASSAIMEAMLNVKYHAYPHQTEKHWWFTATILEDELYIAICDRGVGIPETLPREGWGERLRGVVGDDSKMIQAAMRYTRTSRKKGGAGYGTRDIQRLILKQRQGHLTIISGKGHYRLSCDEHGEEKETTNQISNDVNGTVIQWTISLQPQSEE